MNKTILVLAIAVAFVAGTLTTGTFASAQTEDLIPDWIEKTAGFWVEGHVGDQEFVDAMKHLIEKGIITISQDDGGTASDISELKKEIMVLKDHILNLASDISELKKGISQIQSTTCTQRGPGVNLSYCNFSYTDLSSADFSSANLHGANFLYADLTGANLIDAGLVDANLKFADLSGAHLFNAHLKGADLSYADLSDVNFTNADLSDADLTGATNQPTGDVPCFGKPIGARFTCVS